MSQKPIVITGVDLQARGVGHLTEADGTPGKVVFVDNALPGEVVHIAVYKKKPSWEQAKIVNWVHSSSQRIKPQCPHFGVCGGCSMQHIVPSTQVAIKQRVLEDSLWHIGKIKAQNWLRPVEGMSWGYRFRARLSVRYVAKKGTVLVGFREKKSHYVADIKTCAILPHRVSLMLLPLRELIGRLSIARDIPQIELAVGEPTIAMVLRIMQPLSEADKLLLKDFSTRYGVQWWLQPKGLDSVHLFEANADIALPALYYTLPEFGVHMPFGPTDFTQVNPAINRVLVVRAVALLDVLAQHRVADWFCGLGNFTLALAKRAREVVGIEGNEGLVKRAAENAGINQLADKTRFLVQNLFAVTPEDLYTLGYFDRYLIDPPREGAMALCQALSHIGRDQPDFLPKKIVYVSCSPDTLARDAGILGAIGYTLTQAFVMNMFPHTAHVESMAVFEWQKG